MKFNEKYTSTALKAEDDKKAEEEKTEKGKTELSNDAFAVGELLDSILSKLEQTRRNLLNKI